MSDYAERIESIASKLRDLLEESEELKRLVEQRMMLEEDANVEENHDQDQENQNQNQENQDQEDQENQDQEDQEDQEVPVIPELVTRKPLCFFFCCRRY